MVDGSMGNATLTYKVGVLLVKAGQSREEEVYNNETSSDAFEQFLELLGDRTTLRGHTGFMGGLDNKDDRTGTHSHVKKQFSTKFYQ